MPETDELEDLELTDEEKRRKAASASPMAAPAEQPSAIGTPLSPKSAPAGTPSAGNATPGASLGAPIPPPTGAVGVYPTPETTNAPLGSELTPPAQSSIGTPLTPPAQPHARPNYDAYQTQLHNKAGVENVHGFGGALLKGLDIAGSIAAPGQMSLIPGTRLHHIAEVGRAGRAAGIENQEIASQDEEQLQGAQTEEQQALAAKNARTPPAKEGLTPEETTLHDLMAGDNGKPRINPETQKPYTYLEAYQATNQAKQNVKPEKTPNDFEQYYHDFLTENKFPDTAHNRLLARERYAAAGQTPQRPQQQLAIGPDGKVIELKPGATVAPGTKTVASDLGGSKANADEQRRADLAENMNENLTQLEDILNRRPELFGPFAGRYTSVKGALGTGDPDVAALSTIKEQLGMAMVGAHAMRNAQHVEAAANSILNSYKNQPEAVKGAIAAARNSLKTFQGDIDRSKGGAQGGAAPVGGTHNFTINGKPYENVPDDVYQRAKSKPGFKE